jgi:hypothetical protein
MMMHYSTLLVTMLSLTSLNAYAEMPECDIGPSPSTVSITLSAVDAHAQASAHKEGLSLSRSVLASEDDIEAASIRLVYFNGCRAIPGAMNQIYSGWQQAQKVTAVPSIKNGDVDFNTAGGMYNHSTQRFMLTKLEMCSLQCV